MTLRAALLFVAGFTVIFTTLGVIAGLLGALVVRNLPLIVEIAGAGIIVLGLVMAGVLRIPWLYRERRFALHRLPTGPRAAFGVGMAFAAGGRPASARCWPRSWPPRRGGRSSSRCTRFGLGLPFVGLALGLNRAIEVVGGLLLVGVGVLFVTGAWRSFFVPLQGEFARFGWPPV